MATDAKWWCYETKKIKIKNSINCINYLHIEPEVSIFIEHNLSSEFIIIVNTQRECYKNRLSIHDEAGHGSGHHADLEH